MKSQQELNDILLSLQNLPSENEVVEFKEAKNGYDFRKLGKYFSALSNEANMKEVPNAWLVFGIEDKNHKIIGSNYRLNNKDLHSLKKEIADKTTGNITYVDIYTVNNPKGRVVMFEIPAAPLGLPVAFEGHYYARDGESLVPLNIYEIEKIRNQTHYKDWSASIIEEASLDDLDKGAILVARINYKGKFPDKADEVDTWDDVTFLNKIKVLKKGKITRTAIILLGKEESEHFISPSEAKIRWVLNDDEGTNRDYEIFSPPLLLSVNKAYKKIRNIKYRYLKEGNLFPDEVSQYDPYVIREAINNCIAHQDYTKGGRINIIEIEDELLFTNKGGFIPGTIEKVIKENAPEEKYRNPFLANAMFNLKMVDTIGSGIRRMFKSQAKKFFPLPDYKIEPDRVSVRIIGKVLDIDYANVLARESSLNLEEIIMLDKVQKGKVLNSKEIVYLRKKKLIEGRKPNFIIAKSIAQRTGQKIQYTKNKGFDNEYYLDLIIKALKQHKVLTRKEIDELLWNKLPDRMDEKHKKSKIGNLITYLRMNNKIYYTGVKNDPKWKLK